MLTLLDVFPIFIAYIIWMVNIIWLFDPPKNLINVKVKTDFHKVVSIKWKYMM